MFGDNEIAFLFDKEMQFKNTKLKKEMRTYDE